MQTREDLQEALEKACEKVGIVGASVCLKVGAKSWGAATGFANKAEGIETTKGTLFQTGSIAKLFTATMIQRLVERGHIDLDKPVTHYLPDLKIAGARAPDALNVRTLLDFTAGIEGDFFEDFGEGEDALKHYVEACNDLILQFEPGTMRGYNSTSFSIAGRLVEVLKGNTYEQALVDEVLDPVGIERHGFNTGAMLRYRSAIGHRFDAEQGAFVPTPQLTLPKALTPAGARLAMTAEGLARFGMLHVRDGVLLGGERLIAAERILDIRTSYGTVPPGKLERMMGVVALEAGATRFILTAGETSDQNAMLVMSPEHDMALAIMANVSGGATALLSKVGLDLIEEVTGQRINLPTPDFSEGDMTVEARQILGSYSNTTIYTVEEKEGDVTLIIEDRPARHLTGVRQEIPLKPLKGSRYALVHPETQQAVSTLEFLFMNGDDEHASHISHATRLFSRLPHS
ncbi:MAG: serine hydrolase domain-containing protein [Pseudomonadota bacterium]